MATAGEEKGWTFDAFDSGTLRESVVFQDTIHT